MSENFNDAMATLENAAHRQHAEEYAARAISEARSKLILGNVSKGRKMPSACFFASLAMGLQPMVKWDIETAATNGEVLAYNPDFVAKLSMDALIGVVAHECGHPMLQHHARIGRRDVKRWNIACDLSLNPLIRECGFLLPPGALFPGEGPYSKMKVGLGAEEYYALLPDEKAGDKGGGDDDGGEGGGEGEGEGQGEGEGEGDGNGKNPGKGNDPGGCGGVMKPGDGSPAAERQAEAEWKTKVAQAAQIAKQRGNLPSNLAKLVDEILEPKVSWQDVLRDFLNRHAKNDYNNMPPNRRYVCYDLYLPTLRSEELGDIVIAADVSGSLYHKIGELAAEIQDILSTFIVKVHILYHDSIVQKVQEWDSANGPLSIEPVGGGGTSHIPVFDWVEKQGMRPTCMVCLTDLYSVFPALPPDYPVMWATFGAGSQRAPWGQPQIKVED